MKPKKKLISIVVPCYNEEENVEETFRQLQHVVSKISPYRFEFIFVDNGSPDKTREIIEHIVTKDRRVLGIGLSRNFGVESSGLAGLEHAKGDAIISVACDLQDPVELIPEYIRRWEKGFDMVVGIYTKSSDGFFMTLTRKIYYKIFKAISEIDIAVNSSGITLFSRTALDGFLSLQERFRSGIGLRSWIGFKTDYITYERCERLRGKSSYNLFRYLQTAERGFFGYSYLPLDSIIYFGLLIFVLSFLFLFVYLVGILTHLIVWNQGTVIIAIITLFGGIQLLAMSAIGKYVQVIVEETKQRPHYIIDKIMRHKS